MSDNPLQNLLIVVNQRTRVRTMIVCSLSTHVGQLVAVNRLWFSCLLYGYLVQFSNTHGMLWSIVNNHRMQITNRTEYKQYNTYNITANLWADFEQCVINRATNERQNDCGPMSRPNDGTLNAFNFWHCLY